MPGPQEILDGDVPKMVVARRVTYVNVIGGVPVKCPDGHVELEERAVRGFEAFYREYFGSIYSTALGLSRDQGAAEDLTQDAFVSARKDWPRLSGFDRPDLWVRRAVVNRSASRFRRMGRETRALARLDARHMPGDTSSVRDDDVWSAIGQLPKRQAQVVVLVIMQDLHIDDAADILDCGSETVRTHIRRARRRLAELLKEDDE